MEAVNALIRDKLKSDVALVNELGHYIVGRRRLPPLPTM